MADDSDKTEKPTDKKLQDARKKGEVAKSKELSSTAGLLTWFLLFSMALGWAATQVMALTEAMLVALGQPFELAAPAIASQALRALLAITAAALSPVALVGVLVEFLQAGPVFSTERLQLKFDNLNPVAGLKRMLGVDNLIEVGKALAKTVLLVVVGVMTIRPLLAPLQHLPWAQAPQAVGTALWAAARPVFTWALCLFAMISVIDLGYQRWNFTRKQRMSRHDIKEEYKEQEGDPHVKAQRRQTQEEWSQRHAADATRRANVMVVNPTHVAIAIDYDRELCPVPTIAAKGEGDIARAMREAAQEAGIPIVRNVSLARDLLARADVDQLVPPDLFDVIAEVVLWAREVRDEMQADQARHESGASRDGGRAFRRQAPGEDLTHYGSPGHRG